MTRDERGARVALLAGVSVLAGLLVAGLMLPLVGGLGLATKAGVSSFEQLPTELKVPPLPQISRILAADGSTIATFYYENRTPVPIEQVSPIMRKAIVAIEDSRFYEHGGIDVKGALRALVTNASSGSVQQGGSTITQQYVKRVLVEKAQTTAGKQAATADTLGRKMREARYAIALEKRMPKDQILQNYLNIVYFGDGAYGIYSAARHFFSVPPAQLTLTQAALLAGLVQSPGAYDPLLHPKAAKDRRDTVLRRMDQLHMAPHDQVVAALASPLGLQPTDQPNGCEGSAAPFFCDYVLEEIKQTPTLGATTDDRVKLLLAGGLTIRTTLQPKVQAAASAAVDAAVPGGSQYGAAEALVQPGTGQIQALAVNKPYGSGKGQTRVNYAADYDHGGSRGFQSGSTFKIFELAAALKQGLSPGYTMYAPPVLRAPSGFRTCSGASLSYGGQDVHNAEASEGGTFTLASATWNSVNTYFVKLEQKTGLCEPVHLAAAAGMHTASGDDIQPYPSFTLGVYDVSPLDLANAYATFAAHGRYCPPVAITDVTDRSGKHLDLPAPQCRQAMDPGLADAVSSVLTGVIDHGTGTSAQIGRPAAGKTGTVENFSAAWFCGYVPQLSSCVWMGYPEGAGGRELTDVTINGQYYHHVFGASIPAPIWGRTMKQALDGVPVEPFARAPARYLLGNAPLSLGPASPSPATASPQPSAPGAASPVPPPPPPAQPQPQPTKKRGRGHSAG